jgi:lactoylglutathione lyase
MLPKVLAFFLLIASLFSISNPDSNRPRLLGVAHVALLVSDMGQSRRFYQDFLGFQEPYQLNNADGSLSMTFIKVNDYQYIELFPGLKADQDRLHHLSFYTDNAEQARKYLGSSKIQVPANIAKGRIGNFSFNVKDPEGHTLEFTQYEPTGWSMREKGKFIGDQRVSSRILHVGILVGDVDKAMLFYSDVLGLQEFWRGNARNSTEVSWINMRLNGSEDYLEFMLYSELPPPDKRGTQHHICLEVPDIEKAHALLDASPYRKYYQRPLEIRVGVNRRRQLNLYDPDGTRVELMEPRTVDGKPAPASTSPLPRRPQ